MQYLTWFVDTNILQTALYVQRSTRSYFALPSSLHVSSISNNAPAVISQSLIALIWLSMRTVLRYCLSR
jgi:hypothetical protein